MSEKNKLAGGCLVLALMLFVQLPLWFVLMYGVIEASGAPTWCWVIYWIYVPVNVVLATVSKVFEILLEE